MGSIVNKGLAVPVVAVLFTALCTIGAINAVCDAFTKWLYSDAGYRE